MQAVKKKKEKAAAEPGSSDSSEESKEKSKEDDEDSTDVNALVNKLLKTQQRKDSVKFSMTGIFNRTALNIHRFDTNKESGFVDYTEKIMQQSKRPSFRRRTTVDYKKRSKPTLESPADDKGDDPQ